jgi:hypothetical protein
MTSVLNWGRDGARSWLSGKPGARSKLYDMVERMHRVRCRRTLETGSTRHAAKVTAGR